MLRGDEILYYKSPQDAHARGTIPLTSLQRVESSINPQDDGFPKDLYCLVLETPARNWKLGFEKPDDLASWLQIFAHYLKHTLKQSFTIEKGDLLRASQRSGGPVFTLERGTPVPHSIHCFPGYHTLRSARSRGKAADRFPTWCLFEVFPEHEHDEEVLLQMSAAFMLASKLQAREAPLNPLEKFFSVVDVFFSSS